VDAGQYVSDRVLTPMWAIDPSRCRSGRRRRTGRPAGARAPGDFARPVLCPTMASDTTLLDRYLARVDIDAGPPSLSLLDRIVSKHLELFAFASVGPQLGDPLPLDPESLFDRIVVRRRGGYCFEQNALMFEILSGLGFEVTLVLARVLHDPASHPPLTHRFTAVDLDHERFLVDVGFGANCPPRAVRFDPSNPGDGTYRIVEHEHGEFHLEHDKAGEYVSLYRFDTVRYGEADCEVGHFYSHRHPDAAFVNNLVASRILDGEVRSLRNLDLRIYSGGTERLIAVTNATQLHQVLADMFDLVVSRAEAEQLFARVVERAAQG
jgi:N-hydroxyarylamine O-acetyltransferase